MKASGAGVWFEPYKYDKDVELFGPFALQSNGVATYTDEYNKTKYQENDWYKIGKSTNKNIEWSAPYYMKLQRQIW